MTVTVAYDFKATKSETLDTNVTDAGTKLVTHDQWNVSGTLNANSTPPVTKTANWLTTLTAGSATIDLTAMLGTNGVTVDGTDLKPQIVRVRNLGSNALVIEPGDSNGYALLGAAFKISIPAGGTFQVFLNDGTADIASNAKTLKLTGSGSQTSRWSVDVG